MFSAMVGMARCAVPARVVAGGTNSRATLSFEEVAPLHAARTSQRDVPTTLIGYSMSTDCRDFQPFDFGELRLARVRREEELAFERERPGNVKQVDCASSQTFGVDLGKVCGACDGGVHV